MLSTTVIRRVAASGFTGQSLINLREVTVLLANRIAEILL